MQIPKTPINCDLAIYGERQASPSRWEVIPNFIPFSYVKFDDIRNCNLFGWLAGVRNFSAITPLATPRGLPSDVDEGINFDFTRQYSNARHASWFTMAELNKAKYDEVIEDCLVLDGNIGRVVPAGSGVKRSLRECLGRDYFAELDRLNSKGVERITFWFSLWESEISLQSVE